MAHRQSQISKCPAKAELRQRGLDSPLVGADSLDHAAAEHGIDGSVESVPSAASRGEDHQLSGGR